MARRWAGVVIAAVLAGCDAGSQGPLPPNLTDFDAFVRAQRQTRRGDAARGQQVFLQGPCVTCHTVRGTVAFGRVGPDLTHLASRRTIASGILPNTRGHLAGWVLNPQNLKPGTQMPATLLQSGDLQDLLAFLETLH